jgi:hypothetical protein
MAVSDIEQTTIEEELDGTSVSTTYKVQLLETIIEDVDALNTVLPTQEEDWSDVPPGTFTLVSADTPDESKGGIGGLLKGSCVKPGETVPAGENGGFTADATQTDDTPQTQAGSFNTGGTQSANVAAYTGANQGKSGYGGARTKLGWAIGPANTKSVKIPGIKSKFIVTIEVWPLWMNFVYDFHQEVESVNNPSPEGSLCIRPIRGYESAVPTKWSNHSTGTAVDINYGIHGLGLLNTFKPDQQAAIHRLLSRYEGTVRWGGDYAKRKDDMHWEIDKNEAGIKAFTQKKNLVTRAEQIASGQLPIKQW